MPSESAMRTRWAQKPRLDPDNPTTLDQNRLIEHDKHCPGFLIWQTIKVDKSFKRLICDACEVVLERQRL